MTINFLIKEASIISDVKNFVAEWKNDAPDFATTSSGSTCAPKTIRILKKHARTSAKATLRYLNIPKGAATFLCLNIETIGGKMMAIRSLVGELNLLVGNVHRNPLKDVCHEIDFLAIAPIQLYHILQECPEKLQEIDKVIVGGGAISPASIHLLQKHEITVYQTFGMTETISHIAMRKVGHITEDAYTLLPDYSIKDARQLSIHAPSLGIDKLQTNDCITPISDKKFIWLGRKDFVVNSGGVKINVEEVEQQLASKITSSFFLHGLTDDILGEKLVLIIEGEYNTIYSSKNLYSFLENAYHVPKEVYFVEQFMFTKSEKINRLETVKKLDNCKSLVISR